VSNFDDFDPLRLEPEVDVIFLRAPAAITADAHLVILPGSKATIADLAALRAAGWEVDLAAHVRRGGQVLGLCGGYQMLGTSISDPNGIRRAVDRASRIPRHRDPMFGRRRCLRTASAKAACCSRATRCTSGNLSGRGRFAAAHRRGHPDGAARGWPTANARTAFADNRCAPIGSAGSGRAPSVDDADVEATLDALRATRAALIARRCWRSRAPHLTG
jgi:adenosylcobyric acid synthase